MALCFNSNGVKNTETKSKIQTEQSVLKIVEKMVKKTQPISQTQQIQDLELKCLLFRVQTGKLVITGLSKFRF